MSPRFASAVDPIFLYVLRLLDRIGRGDAISYETERDRIENRFREAEAQVGDKKGWELARYALAAWIDEVLIAADWNGAAWWEENLLEFAYFKTRTRATVFFQKAAEAAKLPRRDALEVFYVCVVLGFRGLYGTSDAAFLADSLDEPQSINEWTKKYERKIQLGLGRPPIGEALRSAGDAAPLDGKFMFVGTSLVSVILLAFVFVVGYFVLVHWQT